MRANKILGLAAAVSGMALVAASFGDTASAATATANLGVSATVTNNCTISTAALAFGSYDPVVTHASTNLDGTGTVTVACTKGVAPTVGLGLGSNATGSTRRMTDGSSNFLTYEVYSDAGRTTVWSDSGGGLYAPYTFSWSGVAAGSYSDTVVASVNF